MNMRDFRCENRWIKTLGVTLLRRIKVLQNHRTPLVRLTTRNMTSIPVIDISALCNNGHETVDQHAKDVVIQQICQACKDVGFFYLTGHGVEQSSLNQIFSAMKNFFALPLEKKNAISVHNSPSYSGYIETRSEKTQNVVDIREGFYFHTTNPDNQFPEERDLPGFADTLRCYTQQVTRLGHFPQHPLFAVHSACTIPVTSADNERANSTLKLVKGYKWTTMTTERFSGLALMNIHHKKPVDYDAVVQKFAEQQPRRILPADPIFEES